MLYGFVMPLYLLPSRPVSFRSPVVSKNRSKKVDVRYHIFSAKLKFWL